MLKLLKVQRYLEIKENPKFSTRQIAFDAFDEMKNIFIVRKILQRNVLYPVT
jgi:hypothetical protein